MNDSGESQFFHTLWIKLEASETDRNFSREIPVRWLWDSSTGLTWHMGGECGWGTMDGWRDGEVGFLAGLLRLT